MNDAVDYLLEVGELSAALAGMRRTWPGVGSSSFDVNTVAGYRAFSAGEVDVDHRECRFRWRGQGSVDPSPGAIFEATLEGAGPGVIAHLHRQRHLPEARVREALRRAGLRCVEVCGELDGELSPSLDEELHTKAVYVCESAEAGPEA